MLEKVALITIIASCTIYCFKSILNFYRYMKFNIGLKREIDRVIESLSSVPTEIKKPRTKKKGK